MRWSRLALIVLGAYAALTVWRSREAITHAALVLMVGAVVVRLVWKTVGRTALGAIVTAVFALTFLGAALSGRVAAPGSAHAARYAALGDSYASGEGARAAGEPYDTTWWFGPTGRRSGSPACHRSARAYPVRLAGTLAAGDFLFTACSGATTADLAGPGGHAGEPGQLAALRRFAADGPVDLVTLTTGGNDLGFAGALSGCVTGSCQPADPFPLGGPMGRDAFVAGVAGAVDAVRSVVGDDVPVLVVGYPQILPPSTAPRCLGLLGLSPAEIDGLRHATRAVDHAIRDAAARAGAWYVDTLGVFAGHQVCSPVPYAHGLTLADAAQQPAVAAPDSFHPTPAGHACLARVVLAQYPDPAALPGESSPGRLPAVGTAGACR